MARREDPGFVNCLEQALTQCNQQQIKPEDVSDFDKNANSETEAMKGKLVSEIVSTLILEY